MGDEALREQAGAGKTGKEAQGTRTGQAARGKAIQEAAERRGGAKGVEMMRGGHKGKMGQDEGGMWQVSGAWKGAQGRVRRAMSIMNQENQASGACKRSIIAA